MNRIDRLTAILIQLQTKPIVKAQEIANRFDISLRTVYRDIRALEEAGIPIGSEAGIGYFLAEGFHLPPVMFTKQEAGSFILAEKLVEKFADNSIDESYKSAMYKIKSVLKTTDKSFIDKLNNSIQVISGPDWNGSTNFPNNFITHIQQSLAEKTVICIDYFAHYRKELTKREVEPIGICYYGQAWHLIAFCRMRNSYRDFRIDRIKTLTNTNIHFPSRKNDTLNEYFERLETSVDAKRVVVRFNPALKEVLKHQKYYFGFVGETLTADYIEMSFLVNPLYYIANWLLSFGGMVEIVKSAELLDEIKKILSALNKHYEIKEKLQ